MKSIILLAVLVSVAACSQEQTTEMEMSTPQVFEKEVVAEVVKDPTAKLNNAETTIEVQTNNGMEVAKAEQPDVKVTSKSNESKQGEHVKDVADVKRVETVTNQEKVEPVATPVKVIAPPTQGKGDIRSEPKNPPKQGMMLKGSLGDAVAGKKVAKKCMSCHSFEVGGRKKVGPNLFAIVGAPKGAVEGYKYGSYLQIASGVWDETSLRDWLKDSKGIAKAAGKKTKMASQRIKGKKADDLIAYLKTVK